MSLKLMSPIYRNKMDFVIRNLGTGRVLDIGSGHGEYLGLFAEKGLNAVGLDVSYEVPLPNRRVVRADGSRSPFKQEVFDLATCVDVLEHISDDRAVLREVSRVLRKGGQLILAVPSSDFPFTYDPINAFLRIFGMKLPIGMWGWGHRRLYSERGIKELLKGEGFKVKKFEQGSHAFIALFVNYIPFIATHAFSPFFRKAQRRRGQSEPRELPKIIKFLNNIDKKYFSHTKSINIYIVAEKK